MVIDELITLGLNFLKKEEFNNPPLELRLILAKLLNVDKSYIYSHGERQVTKDIENQFMEMVKKRSKGYPIQYILGEKEFMGLDFYIEDGVLIPRPDTEILVEYIINFINRYYKGDRINVLDIGAGSGAISLSIAKYCPGAYVYGIDIDDAAIKVSNINKERFDLSNVELLKGDLFEPILRLNMQNEFQIIVSNPPYIPKEEIEQLQSEVKLYEPKLALDGGIDGLNFYRKITEDAKKLLIKNGLLIYEIGYNQGKQVSNILDNEGYKNINILKDLQGRDRVAMGFSFDCEL
ncbi:peptide chain release factor N(5)-glutamine methyltransferase [Paratissierella segnis]|uniref:Release factor glutamine methyltransferase n=1 Tax=Paratissierella segnis TaxID=2763679 RepID=A0A926IKV1_9FIRM|nr:peptide chain release factor N(5)-glutamine methyltransferase [Paratissierella segnis]MBC8588901.1 peptide chain release factor N(5)-glutamine methyltransferase [Paratissierella segnis]